MFLHWHHHYIIESCLCYQSEQLLSYEDDPSDIQHYTVYTWLGRQIYHEIRLPMTVFIPKKSKLAAAPVILLAQISANMTIIKQGSLIHTTEMLPYKLLKLSHTHYWNALIHITETLSYIQVKCSDTYKWNTLIHTTETLIHTTEMLSFIQVKRSHIPKRNALIQVKRSHTHYWNTLIHTSETLSFIPDRQTTVCPYWQCPVWCGG